MPKSEIARRSGLSSQTVSVIMRALEKDGLLLRGDPQRGKVGQPSIPMRLDPNGVLSLGLKIGRRSADLVLVDFLGHERRAVSMTFAYPLPRELLKFAKNSIAEFLQDLSPDEQNRIAGVGVSMPFELWNWAEKTGAPEELLVEWKHFKFQEKLSEMTKLPTTIQNDATSACGAELVFGHGKGLVDFVYFFIGTFIGGGVVLDNSVYSGRTGNAGAFGPMPVTGVDGKMTTLTDHASILTLERLLKKEDINLYHPEQKKEEWHSLGHHLDNWIGTTAYHLARAIVASHSIIDFQATIIDGAFPPDIRKRIVESVKIEINKLDTRGIGKLVIMEGLVGRGARALGAASLPLFSRYLLDQKVLFRGIK
jgi:predicted NBD/HSP70 family sugar kinase